MKRHTHRWAALTSAMVALVLAAAAPVASAQDRDRNDTEFDEERAKPRVVPLKDARLKIEFNSTDLDAGVQLFIDADPWKTMDIFDPTGKKYSARPIGAVLPHRERPSYFWRVASQS